MENKLDILGSIGKYLLPILVMVLGGGSAGYSGWNIFEIFNSENGTADLWTWLLTAIGGLGGVWAFIKGQDWFKKLGKPSPEMAFLCAAGLSQYFDDRPDFQATIDEMFAEIGRRKSPVKKLPQQPMQQVSK